MNLYVFALSLFGTSLSRAQVSREVRVVGICASFEPACNSNQICNPHSDRKSTRLNSSNSQISYAVFCLKKKNTPTLPPSTQPQVARQRHRRNDSLTVSPRDPTRRP